MQDLQGVLLPRSDLNFLQRDHRPARAVAYVLLRDEDELRRYVTWEKKGLNVTDR